MKRRAWLLALLATPAAAQVRRGRPIVFPRDHGAHVDSRTEWWYATGWTGSEAAPRFGFQLTFFRSRTGFDGSGRFAPRQLLFAHAAVTDLARRQHRHAQRIARWNGDDSAAAAPAGAARTDTAVRIGDWSFTRTDAGYAARLPAADFALDLLLAPTGAPLLQGDAGFSRKGPDERQASHYYSVPQLAVSGNLGPGRAWLDHEWSDEILHPDAVGWDWIGINIFDGSALTAFHLRRADGSALWAGGSLRTGAATRAFGADAVRFSAGRTWASPATRAVYPVEWVVESPAGTRRVRALLDAQELDSRGSTGSVYWEGLAELLDAGGRRIGLGYLEMTGYAERLRIG